MTYTVGKTYHGFTLNGYEQIDEIKSHVYSFTHELLNCPLMAIKNDDPNKTFSVAFNTIPTDSTGVAHILEHSVLMGSRKYPINDVFGELNKGGLTTFLNAMTGSDITYYPFATRNLKEYFNIMDVYCDVVLHPLLAQSTFEQEGWHFHKESKESELQYQGVVYNEMKGAFSDPIRLIFHHIFSGLMPGSTYAHESGGDPKNIPDLSYEQFCEFHKQHYHPSNGTFFLYGNADLDEELQFLQDRFLSHFKVAEQRRTITEGRLTDKLSFIEDTYGVESNDIADKTFLAVGTTVSTVQNRLESSAFQIIANILFNSDGSPLKNSIISSGLCKDFGGLYLSSSCFRTFMITYLVGSEPEKRDVFLKLYEEALRSMIKEGLDRDLVISELNKYEFTAREEASKSQRGLDLIGKAMVAFKYGTDPFENIVNEELIKTVRHKALKESFFEKLIEKYLLNNPSTIVVTLKPDPQKGKKNLEEEGEKLAQFSRSLDDVKEKKLIERTQELMKMQLVPNSEETLAQLPRLELADLPPMVDFHSVNPVQMAGKTVLVSELMTNRITYLDVGFDFSILPQRLLSYLDLFGTIATEIGTDKLNYMAFAKEVATFTGNFTHSVNTYMRKDNPGEFKPVFWLHAKCLPTYLEKSIELIGDVLKNLSLADKNRIREIVGREFAWAEHSAQSEGYNLPATRVFAHLSKAGYYNEQINGISSYRTLKDLALSYDEREESFLNDLSEIAHLLFRRDNLILGICGEQNELSAFSNSVSTITESLPEIPVEKAPYNPEKLTDHEAFVTSAEVVFAVQGGNLLKNGKGYSGQLEVLKTYLSREYLWNTVRQMGGAYGCFIQFSNLTGNIAFVSYRDPQVKKTYEAYGKIAEVVEALKLNDKVLQQLIIGTYGNFDPHQSPPVKAAAARNEYFTGITPEYKQKRLQQIISTTEDDLKTFAPAFQALQEKSYRSIIGNRAKIEKDQDLFDVITEL